MSLNPTTSNPKQNVSPLRWVRSHPLCSDEYEAGAPDSDFRSVSGDTINGDYVASSILSYGLEVAGGTALQWEPRTLNTLLLKGSCIREASRRRIWNVGDRSEATQCI